MWILTTFGFFSVVENRRDPSTLMVRGRVRADIEKFVRRAKVEVSILETPTADYRYRAILNRKVVAKVIARALRRLDYPNFKNRVEERQGVARHDVYADVWLNLRRLNELPK
jgi:hypothetical protein